MYKDKISGSIGYGRSTYDFQEGTLIFCQPRAGDFLLQAGKILTKKEGWSLIFHPDLIRKSGLGAKIDSYSFFSYKVNEALHLSAKEEKFLLRISSKNQRRILSKSGST